MSDAWQVKMATDLGDVVVGAGNQLPTWYLRRPEGKVLRLTLHAQRPGADSGSHSCVESVLVIQLVTRPQGHGVVPHTAAVVHMTRPLNCMLFYVNNAHQELVRRLLEESSI